MVIVTAFVQPESSIRLLQRNVRAILDKNDLGLGTLYVSERNLCWQEKDDRGFQIDYNSISLHAISKDTNVYQDECIYVLIDAHVRLPGFPPRNINNENDYNSDDDDTEPEVSELIFVPENRGLIQSIYEAIKVCQELNPDPIDVEDDDDHLYEDAEEDMDEYYEIDEDVRAGGDTAIEELSNRMGDSYLNNSNHNYRNGTTNGDGGDDDEFEDAD